MRAVCLLIVAGLVLLCRAAPAQAQLPPRIAVRLEYEPIPGMDCPSADDLHNYLMAQLGYDPIVETATSTLVVRLRKQGKVFEADSFVRGADGADLWHEPPIHNDMDCWEIAQDAARAVRIGLGPSAWPNRTPPVWLAAEPPPAPAPEPKAPTPIPSAAPARPASTRTAGRMSPKAIVGRNGWLPRPEISAGLALSPGATPGPLAVGATLGGIAKWPVASLGVGVELRGLWATTDKVMDVPVHSSLYSGLVSLCFMPARLSVCALGASGWFHVETDEPASLPDQDAVFIGYGLRASYDWILHPRFTLRPYGDILVRHRNIVLSATTADAFPAGRRQILWSPVPAFLVFGIAAVTSFQ